MTEPNTLSAASMVLRASEQQHELLGLFANAKSLIVDHFSSPINNNFGVRILICGVTLLVFYIVPGISIYRVTHGTDIATRI